MRQLRKHRTTMDRRVRWKWVVAILVVVGLSTFAIVAGIAGWPTVAQVMGLRIRIPWQSSANGTGAAPTPTAAAAVADNASSSPTPTPSPSPSTVTYCKQDNGDGTITYVAIGTGNTVFVDANGFVYWKLMDSADLERAHIAGSYVPYPGGAAYGPYEFWQVFPPDTDWTPLSALPADRQETDQQAYDSFIQAWKAVLDAPPAEAC